MCGSFPQHESGGGGGSHIERRIAARAGMEFLRVEQSRGALFMNARSRTAGGLWRAKETTKQPCKGQVSGHEFTRAIRLQEMLGFSPCREKSQGLKAKLLEPFTARFRFANPRLKPWTGWCPDTCLAPLQILLPRAMVLA